MTDTERDLLRAVCEAPGDNTPRLVYADFLDENGQEERAEFIRVQLTLANTKRPYVPTEGCYCAALGERAPCGWCESVTEEEYTAYQAKSQSASDYFAARDREVELWLRVCKQYEHDGIQFVIENGRMRDQHRPTHVIVRRGFPDHVTLTTAQFMGGPCGSCGERGYVMGGMGRPDRVPCPHCKAGQTPGLARDLFERWPITGVRLSDREPQNTMLGQWRWYESSDINYPELAVGKELFKLIYPKWPPVHRGRSLHFDSPEAARAALSDAAVAYGRELVGLRAIDR